MTEEAQGEWREVYPGAPIRPRVEYWLAGVRRAFVVQVDTLWYWFLCGIGDSSPGDTTYPTLAQAKQDVEQCVAAVDNEAREARRGTPSEFLARITQEIGGVVRVLVFRAGEEEDEEGRDTDGWLVADLGVDHEGAHIMLVTDRVPASNLCDGPFRDARELAAFIAGAINRNWQKHVERQRAERRAP